jgi:hypothetical protein
VIVLIDLRHQGEDSDASLQLRFAADDAGLMGGHGFSNAGDHVGVFRDDIPLFRGMPRAFVVKGYGRGICVNGLPRIT